MGEKMTLIQQLRGRAAFLRDRGRIKSPQLMEQAADALAHLTQPAQVVDAWMTDDGRVIPDRQKATAIRDGGASASSVVPYIIPLTRALPNANGKEGDEWPDGCIKPNSCARHRACMYGRNKDSCRHFGKNLEADVGAAIIRKDTPDAAR